MISASISAQKCQMSFCTSVRKMSIFTTFEADHFIQIFQASRPVVVAARVHGVSVGSETMAISIFRHLEKKSCKSIRTEGKPYSTLRFTHDLLTLTYKKPCKIDASISRGPFSSWIFSANTNTLAMHFLTLSFHEFGMY